MTPSNSNQPRSRHNDTPAVIRADEVYLFDEAARRMRWQEHSRRQAKRLGLRVIRFGSRDYVLGADVLRFFEQLAAEQNSP